MLQQLHQIFYISCIGLHALKVRPTAAAARQMMDELGSYQKERCPTECSVLQLIITVRYNMGATFTAREIKMDPLLPANTEQFVLRRLICLFIYLFFFFSCIHCSSQVEWTFVPVGMLRSRWACKTVNTTGRVNRRGRRPPAGCACSPAGRNLRG